MRRERQEGQSGGQNGGKRSTSAPPRPALPLRRPATWYRGSSRRSAPASAWSQADATRGHLEIHYHSLDELDVVLAKIFREPPSRFYTPRRSSRMCSRRGRRPNNVAQSGVTGRAGLRRGRHEDESGHVGGLADGLGRVFRPISHHTVAHHQHRHAARGQHPTYLDQPAPPPLLPGLTRGPHSAPPVAQLQAAQVFERQPQPAEAHAVLLGIVVHARVGRGREHEVDGT